MALQNLRHLTAGGERGREIDDLGKGRQNGASTANQQNYDPIREVDTKSEKTRIFTEADIELRFTVQEVDEKGAVRLSSRLLKPGTQEYDNALRSLPKGMRGDIARKLNDFGSGLRTKEERKVFNDIRHVGIELNDKLRINGTTFGGWADFDLKQFLISSYTYTGNDGWTRNRIAHEFRHLMKDNRECAWSGACDPEQDARDYANEYYKFPVY